MFVIADEDLPKVVATLAKVVEYLSDGIKRIDFSVGLGDDYKPIEVTGYWTGDVIRIDVRIRNNNENSKQD